MEIREETYQQIEAALPRRRGKEVVSNRRFLEALAYRLENGCKWRKLPKEYGDWHVIYVRANRWAEKGIMEGIYCMLQGAILATAPIDAVSLDSTIVKVHPDGCGAQKKGVQATGRSRGGLTTKIHLIAASDEWAVTFRLSGGNAEDAGEGRLLMEELGPIERPAAVLMDRAYADWKT